MDCIFGHINNSITIKIVEFAASDFTYRSALTFLCGIRLFFKHFVWR